MWWENKIGAGKEGIVGRFDQKHIISRYEILIQSNSEGKRNKVRLTRRDLWFSRSRNPFYLSLKKCWEHFINFKYFNILLDITRTNTSKEEVVPRFYSSH